MFLLHQQSAEDILSRWKKQAEWFGPIFLILVVMVGTALVYYLLNPPA